MPSRPLAVTNNIASPVIDPLLPITKFGSLIEALSVVDKLRSTEQANPALKHALKAIKRVQCQRFRYSYSDVLMHPEWGKAAHFFLAELYGEHDFSERDAQFARIAQAMQRLFPQSVVGVATTLAQLHALSEQLDHAMACVVLSAIRDPAFTQTIAPKTYVAAWQSVGQQVARKEQLDLVLQLGHSLVKLTRTPGLHTMLRMMRGPANAAGLQNLQSFLERGFDTFAALQRSNSGADDFLILIHKRESAWIDQLYTAILINVDELHLWPELK